MEPLDPKLARLVHEGMVQALPDQAREDRVLLGLLARLPQGGPPGGDGTGGDGGDAPFAEGLGGPEAALGDHAARHGLPRAGKAAAGKAAAASLGASAASKVLLIVGLLGAAAGGGTLLGRSHEPPRGHTAATSPAAVDPAPSRERTVPAPAAPDPLPAQQPREPLEASASGEREPIEVEAPGSPAKGGAARARSTASRRPSADAHATTPAPDVLAAEIQQIAAADRALASGDARRALRLAREHATTHPQGQLALEREAIELGARCLLGEAGAAEAAVAFLAAHAEAPAAAKVRTRCAAAISTVDR